MEIVLNQYSWLIYPPDGITMDEEEAAVFFHFDQLLFSVLTENVCGSQLENVILASESGCAAYAALCARNESAHVRSSIGLFVDLVQLIDWEKEPRLDPRSTVAEMTRISSRLKNLDRPVTLPEDMLQAILLARYVRHTRFSSFTQGLFSNSSVTYTEAQKELYSYYDTQIATGAGIDDSAPIPSQSARTAFPVWR